jgi:hypothetical protein
MGVYDFIDRLEERQSAREDYEDYLKTTSDYPKKTYLQFCKEGHYRDY